MNLPSDFIHQTTVCFLDHLGISKKGNSLLVVEHDQETIDQADCLIEIGPEAGVNGGRLVSLKEGIHITDKSHSNASLNCKEFHHFFSNGVRMIPSGIKT